MAKRINLPTNPGDLAKCAIQEPVMQDVTKSELQHNATYITDTMHDADDSTWHAHTTHTCICSKEPTDASMAVIDITDC